MTERTATGAILLAGGQSSRMGTDKGLMVVNGKPMIQWVIEAVQPLTANIIIVANRPEYNRFGHPVFSDEIPDKGPLAGIFTGLNTSENENNFVLSCDIPFISTDVLSFLGNSHTDQDVTVIRSSEKIHPLIGVYNKRCLPLVGEQIRLGELRIIDFIGKVNAQFVPATGWDPENFRNINSTADL